MHVCRLSVNLDLNSFPQKSHGRDIPSRWWASMWSMMAWARPSFLHTLQILVLLPFGRMFELGSIIDLTLSSSCCKSLVAKDLSPWKLQESVCRCAFSNLLNVGIGALTSWLSSMLWLPRTWYMPRVGASWQATSNSFQCGWWFFQEWPQEHSIQMKWLAPMQHFAWLCANQSKLLHKDWDLDLSWRLGISKLGSFSISV